MSAGFGRITTMMARRAFLSSRRRLLHDVPHYQHQSTTTELDKEKVPEMVKLLEEFDLKMNRDLAQDMEKMRAKLRVPAEENPLFEIFCACNVVGIFVALYAIGKWTAKNEVASNLRGEEEE